MSEAWRHAAAVAAWLLLLQAGTAVGDMSFEEQLEERAQDNVPVDEARQEEVRARIRAELEAARIRAAEEEERRRQEEAERQRAWEALPLPYRLTVTHCSGCHPAEAYESKAYTRLGWELTLMRMRYLNGMELEPGERTQIVSYLVENHPASTGRAIMEVVVGVIMLATPFFAIWWFVRRSRRRRQTATARDGA